MKQLQHYEIIEPARAEAIVQKGLVAYHGGRWSFLGFVGLVVRMEHPGSYCVMPPSRDLLDMHAIPTFGSLMDLVVEYSGRDIDFFKL